MGKFLQIRVSAWTYDEQAIQAAWPNLVALAWGKSPLPANSGTKHGVMELAAALGDGLAIAEWPEKVQQSLASGIQKVTSLKGDIENALADWDPRVANSLSNELEDALSDLEGRAPLA